MASRLSTFRLILAFTASLVLAGQSPAMAAPEPSGLPLPRFVSLDSGEVNLRTGPGFQYPVDWVYRREALPLEIVAEYKNWRKVRDWQGDEGWVHKNMLSGRRSVIVIGEEAQVLRSAPNPASAEVARVQPGVVGSLRECPNGAPSCRVRLSGYEGWLDRDVFWGTFEAEVVK